MMTLERSAVLLEWYESGAFGTQNGRLASASLLAKAAAPFVIEVFHDVMSYAHLFEALTVIFVIGAVMSRVAAMMRRGEPVSACKTCRGPIALLSTE